MDNRTVDKLLSQNKLTARYYRGCYPIDKIPKCLHFPCAMVVNLDRADQQGSHWIAIFAENHSKAYYFDSYGNGPVDELKEYLRREFKSVTWNNHAFQSVTSTVCGHYTIFFIYNMCLGLKYHEILRLLFISDNSDYFVKRFIDELLVK
jgi:hypothetical protein